MLKKVALYVALLVAAILLFVLAITVLGNTKVAAPIVITCSIYIFLGGTIKLCKMNDTLKNAVICAIDLLFWIP